MTKLLPILFMSILLSGELEVDGDLKVTGTIQSADSLNQRIADLELIIIQLQAQITLLESQMAFLGQDLGYADCFGVVGGTAVIDDCGICDGDGVEQDCGCGSPGEFEIPEGACDCFGNVKDACGVCGGDAISEDECYVTDIDGNIYETVEIGDQVWMAENLKVTHYKDGSEIPNITNYGDWASLSTGAYSDYNNDPINSEAWYGRLYNWYTVEDDRGVCPDGWHVPSINEYAILTDYLGGESVAGGKMKEVGSEHWYSSTGATNESGFTGLPAGRRKMNGVYEYEHWFGYFWSSSSSNSTTAWHQFLTYSSSDVFPNTIQKTFGYSIRCVSGINSDD